MVHSKGSELVAMKDCPIVQQLLFLLTPETFYLVGAQPPPCCSFARHLVGKMAIFFSFAHH